MRARPSPFTAALSGITNEIATLRAAAVEYQML